MNKGIVRFSVELVRERLRLPAGTVILQGSVDHRYGDGELSLVVEHPSLPENHEGCEAMVVMMRPPEFDV